MCIRDSPVTELRKWCKKIVHVHGKDATIDWDAVRPVSYTHLYLYVDIRVLHVI